MRHFLLVDRSSLAVCALAVLVACTGGPGCLDASNPFDPQTPPELQAPGSLTGRIILDAVGTDPGALQLELEAVRVGLLDETGQRLTRDGAPVALPLVGPAVDAGVGSGTFTFDALIPDRYVIVLDNVSSLYTAPTVAPVRVLPGDDVDVGTLRFVLNAAGGGPGLITGDIDAEGAGQKRVSLYQLRADGVRLIEGTITGGAFSFSGLNIGTYALVAESEGFTPDFRVDVRIGEGGDARLVHSFSAGSALTLFPVSAVLVPALDGGVRLDEGTFFTSRDDLALAVLAFGGVTGMRLATNPELTDGLGAPLPFVPFSAATSLALPASEGTIPIFAQFEARSAGGFTFTSEVFSTSVVRDVSAPTLLDGTLLRGLDVDADGRFLAGAVTAGALALDVDAQDVVSAVDAVAVVVDPVDPVGELVFSDVTAGNGRVFLQQPVVVAQDGEHTVLVAVRDRAGNESLRTVIDVVLDRSLPDVPLLVSSAAAGTQRTRLVELTFDEGSATSDLPVAMQLGLQPLAPNAPIVPYVTSSFVDVDASEIADGQVAAFEARLIDAVGNTQLVQSANVTFALAGRVAGTVSLEGAPTFLPTAPATVRALAGTQVLASGTVDVNGAYVLAGIPEADGVVVEASAVGWVTQRATVGRVDAQESGAAPVPAPDLTLAIARGDITASFRREDLANDDTAHAGIGVSLTLTGSVRPFADTAVTGPDGLVVFRGVPITVPVQAGTERYVLVARVDGYGAGSSETTVVVGNTVVSPDGGGAPIPVLLPANSGEFDVCAGSTGPCVAAQFFNTNQIRIKLRDSSGVTDVRARAGSAFSTATPESELPFLDFAVAASSVLTVAALPDGLVDVFVQTRRSDGSVSDVLATTITRDTVAPVPPSIVRIAAAGALDPRFTRFGFVDIVTTGEPPIGNVAPLDPAHVVVADSPPSAVPSTAIRCADGATCRVSLPGPPAPVEEKTHRIFAWSCDRAGNCSDNNASSVGLQPVESFVIFDSTPPSSDHGTGFDVGGPDLVLVGAERVLRSALYAATIDTGAAETSLGDLVLDDNGDTVADVWGYRLSLQETAVDTSARVFDPTPAPGESRDDVVAPPLPAQDGSRRIFARFIDAAGNETLAPPNPFFRDVRVDTTPPLVTFRVESTSGNAQFTASNTVRIAVDVPPGGEVPALVEVDADDSLFDDDVDLTFPFAPGANLITLPAGPDGLLPISARISDAAGNKAVVVDAIVLDRTGPAVLDLRCATCSERNGLLFSRDVGGAATLSTQLADAGAGATQLRVTVGAGAPQLVASTTAASIVLPLAQTTVVSVEGVDAVGNATGAAGARTLTIVHDAVNPNVAVTLAGGAARTRSTVLQVAIAATDASAVVDMELTTTGSFTGAFVPFSTLTTVDLGNVDGSKTVQVRVRDAAGNTGTGSATIVLDRAAPNASLLLAAGAVATNTSSVNAALTFDEADTTALIVSTVPLDCASATLVTSTTSPFSTAVDLGVGDGTKTVFACVRDSAGNARQVQDTILLDSTPPISSIALDAGASHSLDTTVDIVVTTASDVTAAAFSTAALPCATAPFAAFVPGSTPTISLPAGSAPVDGARTVNACFRDAAGNVAAASDDIILDRFVPTGTIRVESGAVFARSRSVSVDVATDSDVVLMAIDAVPLNCATAAYQAFSSPRIVTLADVDGTQTVRACVKVGAGRTALLTDDIVLDRASPIGTVVINAAAAVTTGRTVTAQLTYDADSAFVLASSVAIDCATAQSYQVATSPSSTIAVDLLGGRGFQPVFACFKDAAGNTSQASDSIFFDESDVTGLTVAINGGAEFATNRNVLVTLIAPPDTSEAKIAEAGTLDCASPVGYAPFNAGSPLPLTLSAGVAPLEGARTVSACIKQGTATPLFAQDVITLDTFAPTGSLTVQGGTAATNAVQVVVSLTAATDVVDVSLTTAATINCAAVTYEPFTATKAFALAGPDGNNTVRACLRDGAGNTVEVSDSIALDRVGPSPVTVTAASFVTSTSATATLSFPAGDTAQVAVAEGSLDCATTGAYVGVTGTRTVALSAGDGTKTIVACFKDAAGNTSQAATQTVLDTADPSGTVVIDGGATFSTDTSLTLTLTAPADATQMSIAETSINCATATYVAFVAQPSFTISATQGTRVVAVCFKDLAGRTSQASDSIVLDTAAPAGTLVIDNGAATSRDRDVVVTVTPSGGATDIQDMAVADGATLACGSATYTAFSPALPRTLPSGDGTKQIAACLRDRAGNVSTASFASSIVLDETPPNGSNSSLSVAAGAAFTTSATVSLTLTFPADVTLRSIANDGLDCASATYVAAGSSPATIAGHVLSSGDGNKLVVACVKDGAGNTFLVSDGISLDTVAPSASDTSLSINGGAARTASAALSVTLSAPADATTVALTEGAQSQVACDALASGFVAVTSPIAFNLANVSEGTKTISACFRESAGRRLVVADTIFFDPNRPTLTSFTLDGGAAATRDRDVDAVITGASTDVVSLFVADGAIADCSAASPYLPFTPGFARTLSATDGSKTVSLCLKDETGNTSATASTATITLDTAVPAGVSVTVNAGAASTSSTALTVSLAYATGAGQATQFAVAEGAIDCSTATRSALDGASPDAAALTASAGDGTKVIVACFFDAAGNITTAQDAIVVDATPPTGTIVLGGGAAFSTTASTSVTLTAPDDTALVFLQTGGSAPTCSAIADASYVAFPATVALGADGAKTVFACFRDAAGNKSASAASDTITLDTTAPVVSAFTAPSLTNQQLVSLSITATDANAPLQMALGNNALNCATASYTAFASPTSHTILSAASTTVHLCVKDAAGNTTATSGNTVTISLDTTPPAGVTNAIQDGGDGFVTTAGSVTVQLNWSTAGDVAQVKAAEGAIDCTQATGYVAVGAVTTTNLTVSISAGDGTKTVLACFKDVAGNTATSSDQTALDTQAPAGTIVVANNDAKTRLAASVPVSVSSSSADVTQMAVIDVTSGSTQTCANGTYASFGASSTLAAFASATNNTKTVGVCFRDQAGNQSSAPAASDTIVLDTALVGTGITLTMQGTKKDGVLDSALTRVQAVTLRLSGVAADVVGIEIANDSTFASAIEDIFANGVVYPFLLDPGDGVKDVFVRLTDDAGNTVVLQDGNPVGIDLSITLDTQAPSAPVALLKDGDAFATSVANVPITLTAQSSGAQDGTLEVRVSSNDTDFSDAGETFTGTFPTRVTFTAGDGLRNVFAQFRDEAGNETAVVSDSINVDTSAPTPLADITCPLGTTQQQEVCINAGQDFTNSVSVTLQLTSSVANGVATEMQIATDGVADTEPFIPYSTFVTVLLSSTQGTKTIGVKFRDAAGNVSAAQVSDSITLDTITPTSPRIANTSAVTVQPTEVVTLSVQAADTNGFVYQLIGGDFPDWTDVFTTDNFTFNLTNPTSSTDESGDVYPLGIRARDPAGNISAEDFVIITCDGNAPSTPQNLVAAERSSSVTLRWNRPLAVENDVVGYLVRYGYDASDLTDTFAVEGPSPIFVPLPGGSASPGITLTGLADNTPFSVTVSAVDHAGNTVTPPNESPQTAPVLVLPNLVAPVVRGGVARRAGSPATIASRGSRVYSIKSAVSGADLCVYDVSDPRTVTEIACRNDASLSASDKLSVFGRFAYVYRNGATTRVIDIGKLGGSLRGSPASVAVTALADANTQNIVDIAFPGAVSAGTPAFAVAARANGANTELRLLQLPAASGALTGDLGTVGGTSSAAVSGVPQAVDSSIDLVAVASTTFMQIHLTSSINTFARLSSLPGAIRDVKVETTADDPTDGVTPRRANLFIGGDFGFRMHGVRYSLAGGGVQVDNAATVQLGGFDCSSMEVAAGYVYCNDTSNSTLDSMVVIQLAPTPKIVGRLLVVNTTLGGNSFGTVSAISLTENMIFATLNDSNASIAAVELADASRFFFSGSTGIDFDEILVDRNLAYAFTVSAGGVMNAATFDITNPEGPVTIRGSTGSIGSGCDGTATRRSRAQLFGRTPVTSCADGFVFGTTNHPFNFVDGATGTQQQPTTRLGTDVSRTRSMVVDGHTAYVLTNDSQIEVWSLGRPTAGPVATLTVGGAAFSRTPSVQDDRLVVVDDGGTARSFALANTTAATPSIAAVSAVVTGAGDTTRFGDTELRGNAFLVSRPLSVQSQAGLFNVVFNPQTGVFGAVQTRTRGFGAIAPMAATVLSADGFTPSGTSPGGVAGVSAVRVSNLGITTSSQAILSPFGVTVLGPTVISVNRDSGMEMIQLSR